MDTRNVHRRQERKRRAGLILTPIAALVIAFIPAAAHGITPTVTVLPGRTVTPTPTSTGTFSLPVTPPTPTQTPTETATPGPVCTQPICGDGEELYCPDQCPGGCGSECRTKPTTTPSPTNCVPEAMLAFSFSVHPPQPVVGHLVELSVEVRTTSGPAFVPGYSLFGADPFFEGDTSLRSFPHLMSTADVHRVTYELRAVQSGTAQLHFSANYEVCGNCCDFFFFTSDGFDFSVDIGTEAPAATATTTSGNGATATPLPTGTPTIAPSVTRSPTATPSRSPTTRSGATPSPSATPGAALPTPTASPTPTSTVPVAISVSCAMAPGEQTGSGWIGLALLAGAAAILRRRPR